MELRWSPEAADDLERIVEYIRRDSPETAVRVARQIYESAATLAQFPFIGRVGSRVRDTRELVLPNLPFIVVYRVRESADAVEIAGVIHGAQQWPRQS